MAQTELQVSFGVYGREQPFDIDIIRLDIDLTARYYAVNGVLIYYNDNMSPVDGTCAATPVGGIYCNINADSASLNLDLGPNLTGTITIKNAFGSVIETAPLGVLSVR